MTCVTQPKIPCDAVREGGMTLEKLREMQRWSLERKIYASLKRIQDWYLAWDGQVYVSFSGGKDSTVLLHMVRSIYPDVPAVFVDTGLEYPEIRRFVKHTENVIWLKPKMNFRQVIEKYGYPVISKEISGWISDCRTGKTEKQKQRIEKISNKWKYLVNAPFKISDKCCLVMKKQPAKQFESETGLHPMIGNMAEESVRRTRNYLKIGCNAFEAKRPLSRPLSFWTENDIWQYLKQFNVPYSKVYDMGEKRTGCMFCMFGVHLEPEPNRFQRMKRTHPAQWRYCMTKLGLAEVLDYINVDYGKLEVEQHD